MPFFLHILQVVVTALKFFLSSDDPKEDEDKSDSDVSCLFLTFQPRNHFKD